MTPSLALPRLRTLLLIFGLLALVQLFFAFAAFFQSTYNHERGFAFPGPERVRQIVFVVDQATGEQRNDIAQALNDEKLDVAIVSRGAITEIPHRSEVMPGVEAVMERYLETLGDREVIAWVSPDDPRTITPPRLGPEKLWSKYPLRMAIELGSGDWLLIETRGNLAQGVFGFPPGFWAGIFGVTVAFASLWLLWRSLSPLTGLAAAVDRFSSNPVAHEVPAKGPAETRRIIDAVNRMQTEISGFISERQVMFGALSHDLRTILTRLTLRIAAMSDAEARERAEQDLFSMNAIVENALVLARLDAKMPVGKMQVELSELLSELKNAYPDVAMTVAGEGLVPEESMVLGCNGADLFRAIQNLIENAIAYAHSPEILIVCDEASCDFSVLDRGPGIVPDQRANLMRPFVRGKGSQATNNGGSGLGLAIANRTALRVGGDFSLLDREGGGLIAKLKVLRIGF